MHIKNITVGEFQANCWIVRSDSRQAIVIDPGADHARINAFLDGHSLTVAVYLLTHGHFDHVSALAELYRAAPAPIGIHRADAEWIFDEQNQMPPFYLPQRQTKITRLLDDRQEWTDSDLNYNIISTPGHTPGSVCILFPKYNALFTGDTLFAGSIGRTDLPGGDDALMRQSLAKLSRLPDATAIYPGHGPTSAIGREKNHNPYFDE